MPILIICLSIYSAIVQSPTTTTTAGDQQWAEWRSLLIARVDRIGDDVTAIKVKVAVLETRGAIYAGIAGAIAGGVLSLVVGAVLALLSLTLSRRSRHAHDPHHIDRGRTYRHPYPGGVYDTAAGKG